MITITNLHKARLKKLGLIIVPVFISIGLMFVALQENINLFYTPEKIISSMPKAKVRLGGMVVKGSVVYGAGTFVAFSLTDGKEEVIVNYSGLLPDLFREGQGIVTEGTINSDKVFKATRVLAKHDESYMPAREYKRVKDDT